MEAGRIVWSLRGHDRDSFYLVLTIAGGKAHIADGRRRKLSKPKAKNPAHLRETAVSIKPETVKTDKQLRELLRDFRSKERETPSGGGKCPYSLILPNPETWKE